MGALLVATCEANEHGAQIHSDYEASFPANDKEVMGLFTRQQIFEPVTSSNSIFDIKWNPQTSPIAILKHCFGL
jgi:hypothetical protein